jgi:hypothetical protein
MAHAVLLGDSVFDNAAYVGGGPDVIHQLGRMLAGGHQATLLAIDGAVMAGIPAQLGTVPPHATHLVVSVGGNDALQYAAVLSGQARSMADALDQLGTIGAEFRSGYANMLSSVLARTLPTAVCTIYEPRFPDPLQRQRGSTALAVLNDAITREAFAKGVTLLDLRLICNADEDFANPIEPSVQGGRKIADAIASFIDPTRSTTRPTLVIAR